MGVLTENADIRVGTRRRGPELEDAIRAAAFAEFAEVGYGAFSVESVAARARTGKASIYRRWPTKQELVLDAMMCSLPTAAQCGISFDLDDDVTTVQALHQVADAIAATLLGPAGAAIRAIKCESYTDPDLARLVDERFQEPRRQAMLALLRRGVERGEVRSDACTPLIADVLPAVLAHRVILQREPLTATDVEAIIEQVLIPLVEAR